METYVKVDARVLGVKSKVPLVVINTFGRPINSGAYTEAHIMIFERTDAGEAAIADEPQFSGHRRPEGARLLNGRRDEAELVARVSRRQ